MTRRVPNTIGRIVGYHGCDRNVAEKLLSGIEKIKSSANPYDWLGEGAYFWVDSPARAASWAEYLYEEKKISEPYVVGAFISTGLCLNLMDIGVMQEIRDAHDKLLDILSMAGEKKPKNSGHRNGVSYHRTLDAAVFNYLHDIRRQSKQDPYDTVIAAFEEGDPVYKGAAFLDKTHVQLAVRNDNCIIGYFRVRERN